jgi:predicted AAA+ superfamily ATPase
VLLYATSNRRHLVPEKESDNENWKRSTASCTPAKRWKTRLPCLTVSACGCRSTRSPRNTECGRALDRPVGAPGRACLAAYEALDILAVRWATGRGNRNGRCAYQFARYWVGLQLLEQNK